ncbi:hypothetical protein [Agrobacterium bohemicum]|uniref:Uncharacterized protein n=1 Tax=Agrobacterium bohemicum TaxID=2052828 RepID=A0A135P1P3_9HYPH|nr:hypothetical protein [Agrobacterium bohemicum]KXG85342.1 hypothetical protein ATO67_09090 [Agrobacterium bohemicum]
MLPPVSAVSAVDMPLSTSTPRQDAVVAPGTPAAAPQTEPAGVVNLASGTGIRAVSGELQLSDNVNVLAETLGKLLNIARMDGEAADAYVNRLVANIQTLPADQKATLEKALGSILRGISLDALANILKTSAGPEAARLAIMFELSRSSVSARAPKPSITPYLQDILPDSPVISQIRATNPPSPATAAATTNKAMPVIGAENPVTAQPKLSLAVDRQPPAVAAVSASLPQAHDITTLSNAIITAKTALASVGQNVAQPTSSVPAEAQTANANPVVGIGRVPLDMIKTALMEVLKRSNAAQPPQAEFEQSPEPFPVKPIDRQSMSAITAAFSGATPKEMENLLLAVVLSKLPSRGEGSIPEAMLLPGAHVESERAVKSQPLNPSVIQPSVETETQDAALANGRPDIAAIQRAALAEDIKAAILDQPALQAAVAAIISKEGTGLPFVTYPFAKDEDESDTPHRGRWPSSEGEAENGEDGEQADQGSAQEERTAANDEVIDHSLSEGANDDGAAGNAESYYLRMSGFS